MKLLSVGIPCYNSGEYMGKSIESLLIAGDDVEIIIVNDGSTDNTLELAYDYAKKYPGIIKVVDKENGGHGSAVNAALQVAEGLYFKVVDSDDWVSETVYPAILDKLKEFTGSSQVLDMLVSNFVYDHNGIGKNKVMRFNHALPKDRLFTWDEVGRFRKGQYMLMHAVIFRTKLLKECGMKLPEKTFYVDNIFVFEPLPYVKNIYYMDVNFYRYFIGREGQSVNEKIMISRIDQQIKVNKIMIDYMVNNKKLIGKNRHLKKYMINYLDIITTISSVMLLLSGTEENLQKKKELWNYLSKKDPGLFRRIRYGIMGQCINLPGKPGRKITVEGYKLARRFYRFN